MKPAQRRIRRALWSYALGVWIEFDSLGWARPTPLFLRVFSFGANFRANCKQGKFLKKVGPFAKSVPVLDRLSQPFLHPKFPGATSTVDGWGWKS
jgi:hypothetical protein